MTRRRAHFGTSILPHRLSRFRSWLNSAPMVLVARCSLLCRKSPRLISIRLPCEWFERTPPFVLFSCCASTSLIRERMLLALGLTVKCLVLTLVVTLPSLVASLLSLVEANSLTPLSTVTRVSDFLMLHPVSCTLSLWLLLMAHLLTTPLGLKFPL